MTEPESLARAHRLSVAPMMDWTDRHCRFFLRQISANALLYTEMVTAQAVIHGDRDRLLGFDPAEHPVALQLGGSEPEMLARAVRLAAPYEYDEINLNCGCPSDRVQSGCFGAVLMKDPARVAGCVAAMIAESPVPVTVKCRIGVDEQDPERALPDFLSAIAGAGVRRVTIHARKAWLQGLSPRDNREIPPLDYPLVLRMAAAFPALRIGINGGVQTLDSVQDLLEQGLAGVMVGRAAYHAPMQMLGDADARLWDGPAGPDANAVALAMLPYVERVLASGGRLHDITRHMLGLFAGQPGARTWRRVLSEEGPRRGAGPEVIERALAALALPQAA